MKGLEEIIEILTSASYLLFEYFHTIYREFSLMQNTVEVLAVSHVVRYHFSFSLRPLLMPLSLFSSMAFLSITGSQLGEDEMFPMSAEFIDYSMQHIFIFLPFSTQQLSLFSLVVSTFD